MKIYTWLGIALVAAAFGAHAQGIHKCVGKDGKTAYSNSPCPGSKEIQSAPPAAAAGSGSDIPAMQAGKWNVRLTRNGRAKDDEMCGDPIDGFRQEVQTYAAKAKEKWGCTMSTNKTGSRNVNVVYDCPSDRSPEGRPVQKGRWELSLISASPQAFRLELKSTSDPAYVMEGTRIGECK